MYSNIKTYRKDLYDAYILIKDIKQHNINTNSMNYIHLNMTHFAMYPHPKEQFLSLYVIYNHNKYKILIYNDYGEDILNPIVTFFKKDEPVHKTLKVVTKMYKPDGSYDLVKSILNHNLKISAHPDKEKSKHFQL